MIDDQADNEQQAGPNIIVMSEASKPIFSRWGNEEDFVTVCGLVQAIRACALDDESLGELQSIKARGIKFVFMTVGALTLVAYSKDLEADAYLRMQLEYVYEQILFTLTDHVQSIFVSNSGFDLRSLLGGATDAVMRGILHQAGHLGNAGPLLTSGIESLSPISHQIRDTASRIIVDELRTSSALFALLIVGNKLVTMVQPKNHTLSTSDVHLILNFVNSQLQLLSTSELWCPICLPRFHSGGFVHAYTTCFDIQTGTNLVLISLDNTTEQFDIFRAAADRLRSEFGFPKKKNSVLRIHEKKDDSKDNATDLPRKTHGDDVAWQRKGGGLERGLVVVDLYEDDHCSRIVAEGTTEETIESESHETLCHETSTEEKSNMSHYPADVTVSPLAKAITDALKPSTQEKMIQKYLKIASAIHFVFRCDVPIRENKAGRATGGILTQCLSPPVPLESSKKRVWNMYQRLSLRLRLGSASVEVTMDALDSIVDNGNGQGKFCPAQRLFESPPNVHGVTYMLDDSELFIGLNGKDFELYATLPGTILPKNGAALCARLVRRLMNDEGKLFLAYPLSWRM